MFVYNSLLFPQHDLDSVMFKIQLPTIQKFNENVMARSFPLNLKQTYQSNFVCPSFFFSLKLVQTKIFFILIL